MPTPPPGLIEWLGLLVQPAVILGGGALFLNQLNKRIDDQGKRIDNLRSDMKDGLTKLETRQREDNKALKDGLAKLETRQEAMRAEQREDNKALNEKLDRLWDTSNISMK